MIILSLLSRVDTWLLALVAFLVKLALELGDDP